MGHNKKRIITTGLVASLGFAAIPAIGIAAGLANNVSATASASGAVRLNAEVVTAIAMKIVSPNDVNPDCLAETGVIYGVANRYATSDGSEGSKQVDTFDGTTGGADEVNTNTSCAKLNMTPNTFDSTYSDVTIFTNSPNGYAISLQAAEPNLVNVSDNTQYIPAGTLAEASGTVSGGQNKWAYKTDNGIITSWTPASTTAATIKSYDQETSNGSTTRVTYGISTGSNPTGTYAATLTYTATMFDSFNPFVAKVTIPTATGLTFNTDELSIPSGTSKTVTVTPADGYFLSAVSCPTGLTCTGYETGEPQTAAQTITVTNPAGNTSANLTTLTLTAQKLTYTVNITNSNTTSGSASLSIPYGESRTVTVTPASGYYLSGVTCPSGYTCTGYSTGTSYTGQQTVTIANNNTKSGGTLAFSATVADPFAACGSAAGSTCTVAGVQYIRLKDGHLWTKNSQGSTTWNSTLSGVSCPSGTSKPTAAIFQTLVKAYGGTNNSSYGSPYGTYDGDADLYNATGWSGTFWSTTEYNSSNAWRMYVGSSTSTVASNRSKSNSTQVVCYR